MTTTELPQHTDPLSALVGERNDLVFLRNIEPGPTVHSTSLDASQRDAGLVWQGAGDKNGEDIQPVPLSAIRGSVQLQRAIRLGILEIVDEAGAADLALEEQKAAWDNRKAAAANASKEALEIPAADSLQVYNCLAGAECTNTVPMRAKDHAKKPPLCTRHGWMAEQFMAQEDSNLPLVGGKAQIVWVKPSFGAPPATK